MSKYAVNRVLVSTTLLEHEQILCISDAVIEVLNKYHDFEKNSKYLEKIQWVEKLCSDNKLDTACARAESFGTKGESFSEIYKAIEIFEHQQNNNVLLNGFSMV